MIRLLSRDVELLGLLVVVKGRVDGLESGLENGLTDGSSGDWAGRRLWEAVQFEGRNKFL